MVGDGKEWLKKEWDQSNTCHKVKYWSKMNKKSLKRWWVFKKKPVKI